MKFFFILCAAFFAMSSPLFPQTSDAVATHENSNNGKDNRSDKAASGKSENEKKESDSRKVNVDAMLLYGQFNRILWAGSMTQSFDVFTYQLNSNLNRSNDFGYKNSRYYVNEIGITGEAAVTDKWKITPEVEVNNDSYGMFRNPFYTREEKDRVEVKIKNDYTPMPSRWNFNIGGIYDIHRLDAPRYPDPFTVRTYHSSDFYELNAEIGWQYILSASNKLSFNSKFANYFYTRFYDEDTWVENEFLWNFNVSEYLKFALGPLYAYNRDRGHFPSGKINVALVNIKYLSADASYTYELVPFAPENYYYDQRYVRPAYNLYPGKGHHVDLTVGVNATNSAKDGIYIKKFNFKASGSFITNDRYYSFFSLPEQILAPHQMNVSEAIARCETALGWSIYTAYLELGAKYQYSYYFASGYVTYQPEHQASGYIRISAYRFETEIGTSYRGIMHASPFFDVSLHPAYIGYVTLQFRAFESFYLYGRIDNLYNSKYSTVYGYPEQGRTVIGGVRIIL